LAPVKKLGNALARILDHHHRALKQLTALPDPLEIEIASTITLKDIVQVTTPNSPTYTERQQQRRERRLARYQKVKQLYQRGLTLSALATQTSLDCKTVRKYAYADEFPERQSSSRSGVFSILTNPICVNAGMTGAGPVDTCLTRFALRGIRQD
jgi:hypothetical protein